MLDEHDHDSSGEMGCEMRDQVSGQLGNGDVAKSYGA